MSFLREIIEIILNPIAAASKMVEENKLLRKIFLILMILLLIGTTSTIVYFFILLKNNPEKAKYLLDEVLPIFLAIIAIVFFVLSRVIIGSPVDDKKELADIKQERDDLRHKIEAKSEPSIFDTVQLSLNQMTEYYTINKSQARRSFNFSIFAIVVGLITIIAGVWLFYLNAAPNINLTILTGIAGLLLEFIGGAYFFVYRKSLEQVNFFFTQLVKIQDTMLSINLAKDLGDKEKEIESVEKIIESLLERSLK